MATQRSKIRTIVLTGAFTATTVVGVWYGVGLRTTSQFQQKVRDNEEATVAQKLAILEEHRSNLVAKRKGIEKKIDEIKMRAAGASRAESMVGRERER